ncbi:alanine dehydrogenase [Thiohalobacter sp. IOR34]|uniref:alanine dehydrogenase n=1 Tax=Thiohalobacter sp. IOR34 TaxID=3057176 RepID=UPI0025AEFEAC|nr:alanine dehydrogenase [Thiohalobacter sp. IOR34]WJW74382.1 alanine dehydrogenase [Thiohalobacter sp. IOR34]
MRIGIPKEIKPLEGRVGLVPAACSDLVKAGHALFVQRGAGEKSGYPDDAYEAAGARILPDAAALYESAELIVKVKEPVAGDLEHLRQGHLLFCYLHLAANPELARALQRIGLTAVAFETLQLPEGGLPLLAPMSDIAGRLAAQIGATLLHQPQGGKGVLLGGLPAAERGRVTVLGAGTAGGNAAAMVAAMGAEVTVFDRKRDRLAAMRALGPNVTALYPYPDEIAREVARSDILIGAVLIPGARAPHLVSREQVAAMGAGSVVIDISVDQGGCIETTRPTTWEAPTFVTEGVVHFGVTNMPGAVPRSASQALSAALIPWVRRLAGDPGWSADPALAAGINVRDGEIVHLAVRAALE